jgi:hypothetical protein
MKACKRKYSKQAQGPFKVQYVREIHTEGINSLEISPFKQTITKFDELTEQF